MTDKQPDIPARLTAWLDDIRPRADALPFDVLRRRFKQSQEGGETGIAPFTSLRGVEQMAEVRIREWMKREEDLKRLSSNQPPKNNPPNK